VRELEASMGERKQDGRLALEASLGRLATLEECFDELRRSVSTQEFALVDALRKDIDAQEKKQERLREDLGVRICDLSQSMAAQEQKHELLRQGLTELHLQCVALSEEASWTSKTQEKPSSEKDPDGGDCDERAKELHDHTATAQAATVACAAAASNMDALLEATGDLAKLLDVEREARRTGLHDLEVRFSNDVADSIRLIEKRSSDFKAMFTVASKSNDKKYAKFAAEMAELWDIFEVRVREVTGRVEWLELKRKRGKVPGLCASSGSSDGCGGKCVGDAFDEGSQSDDSQSHSGDSTRTLSTCDVISNGTNGSASAPGSGNVGCVDAPAACLGATVLVPVLATNDA